MKDVLKDFLRFVWRRDSESMTCLIIVGSWWLSDRDARQMADYFEADCRLRALRAQNQKVAALGIPKPE